MLRGKKGAIIGVANKRSLAWAAARAATREGADLVLTCQNERFERSVRPLLREFEREPLLLPCDVDEPGQIERLAEVVAKEMGGIDFLVHSLAYANPEELRSAFHHTSKEGFRRALETSVHSFISLAQILRAALYLAISSKRSL